MAAARELHAKLSPNNYSDAVVREENAVGGEGEGTSKARGSPTSMYIRSALLSNLKRRNRTNVV
jgi:hypothetical protein